MTKNRKTHGIRLTPHITRPFVYFAGFAALFVFLTWGYGDVLVRAEQESYICSQTETMQYLLSRPFGRICWLSRWGLLLYRWVWLGGACLALIYTLTARLTDYALRIPQKWAGLGFIVPLLQIGWILARGTRLYYRSEPSLFVLWAVAILLLAALAAGVVRSVRHKRPAASDMQTPARPYGLAIVLAGICLATAAARWLNEPALLTARMQNMEARSDWHGMIVTGRKALRPSRAVAAYYAMALEERDCLLEGLFLIPHDYPQVHLRTTDGPGEEYGIFLSDAYYHAGLLNASRHTATNRLVVDGPRLCTLKRLAWCALLSGERVLCRKYLTLIKANPFEPEFVDRLTELLRHPDRIQADPVLRHVLSLRPHDSHFEQAYAAPLYIGYNLGLARGNAYALQTSIAACLYAKRLDLLPQRADVLAANRRPFPDCLRQALAIAALKQPELQQRYPQAVYPEMAQLNSFLLDAQPYKDEPRRMRSELRDRWGGTYYYYYYTENTDNLRAGDASRSSSSDGGVN